MRMGREVDDINIEKQTINLAYKHSIPIVCTNDIYFDSPDMLQAQECLMCIADGKTIESLDKRKLNKNYCFKSPNEMIKLFNDIPEAIENTLIISKRCHFLLEESQPILPKIISKTEASEDDMLSKKSHLGLEKRINKIKSVKEKDKNKIKISYTERLNYELDVIRKMGYSGYFLIVGDFINWAKDNDIPVGPGRGSGAGSLVAWLCL